jgi:hypothetical protein
MYRPEPYRDTDTGRTRWAVLHPITRVWYFPARYGRGAAEALAARLNGRA